MNKPRIFLIGLRTTQAKELQLKFRKKLKIAFVEDQDIHCQRLKGIKDYDKIVVCTKFTNHNTHNACKKLDSYQMVSGGFSSVRTLLQEYADVRYNLC